MEWNGDKQWWLGEHSIELMVPLDFIDTTGHLFSTTGHLFLGLRGVESGIQIFLAHSGKLLVLHPWSIPISHDPPEQWTTD